ncbi:flagellar basal body P-ring biosynthesis protein FlgA [Roseibium aquae]|uniref:Flagellar basal body P-ring biosynthesis protein FlgA n=1 Tax=Roseibium aquae TaxID=1323746 RepID=A0A916TCE6_9HYPH|nr:flagellar basal body P-ring formation chaperone FlgA [Roseibium aquae]GGB37371.1 flagellar basal body P-ring biosynthesis protein FlgA [Roseibium aquae]
MMKSVLTLLYVLIVQALLPFAAMADQRPHLRSEVHTLSGIVTVGDFYVGAGEFAEVPLFRSPDLGTSGNVPASMVAERARQAGLIMAGTDGLRQVVVHRRAEVFDRQRLIDLITGELAQREASLTPDLIEMTFDRPVETLEANPADAQPVRFDQVLWSRTTGRFSITGTVATESGRRPISFSGRAQELMEVATLAQPLQRGSILKEEDIVFTRLPRNAVPSRALTDPAEVVGLAARNPLRANTPLSRTDFAKPILIERGENVTITYEIAGMKLTTRGRAMDDGAVGDLIDIKNLESRRFVPAMVVSRGQVVAQPASARVARLQEQTQ